MRRQSHLPLDAGEKSARDGEEKESADHARCSLESRDTDPYEAEGGGRDGEKERIYKRRMDSNDLLWGPYDRCRGPRRQCGINHERQQDAVAIGRYTPIHARRTNCPLCPWEGRNRDPIAAGIEEGSRVASA